LETNLHQALTLRSVARAVGVSASHLSALFAAQCGVGPMHYLQRLRVERACWLLSNPYLRIHEVAEACGYEDVNYFTRLFRRSLGISPGHWRTKRLLGHNEIRQK
jgi:transcriptional regulator GlxA family with amidase domain